MPRDILAQSGAEDLTSRLAGAAGQTLHALENLVVPSVMALGEMGHPYQGVLYAGLLLSKQGPKLIDDNARFGDPATEVLMMRLKSDVLELLWASAHSLKGVTAKWDERFALTVVLAAKGYPGEFQKGNPINGLNQDFEKDVYVFHAGTALKDGQIVSNGGRVLNVTALGALVTEAQSKVYKAIDQINWEGGFCRRDIGWRAITK